MNKTSLRPIRVEGNIAYVPLTKGYTSTIDAADVPLVADKNWCAMVSRRADGSIRSVYAVYTKWPGQTVLMHRVLLSAKDGERVDHESGDGLDNRRSANLRLATPAQNAMNARLRVASTSGAKGVTWVASRGRWLAQIKVDGRNHFLDHFLCRTAAAVAYAVASRKMHGRFGRVA